MSQRATAGSKLPPFGRELLAAKSKGQRIDLHVHAGAHAWQRAKSRAAPHVLCLPDLDSFEQFEWTCVSGLEVTLVVWDRTRSFTDAFARALVIAGAEIVAAIGLEQADGSVNTEFYRPRRVRA